MAKLWNSEEVDLVKKPVNVNTGKEYEQCEYALFTGCMLGACEPELVVKLYDSLRFQHPDLGMILMCCEEADGIRSAWEELGKPKMICSCPTCVNVLKEQLPEIEIVSLYKHLADLEISGGCHEETYCIWEDTVWDDFETVKALAEDMGVKVQTKNDSKPEFAVEEESPFITCNINNRNMLREEGHEAIHLLELIYGIGDSEPLSSKQLLDNRLDLKATLLELCFTI